MATLFLCYLTSGFDCIHGVFDGSMPTSCPSYKHLKSPCGHINLLVTERLTDTDYLTTLVCSWIIAGHRDFATNLTVLALNMPFRGHELGRPTLCGTTTEQHYRVPLIAR